MNFLKFKKNQYHKKWKTIHWMERADDTHLLIPQLYGYWQKEVRSMNDRHQKARA